MNELKQKYLEAKATAKALLNEGKIRAHIAQLARVSELQLQMMNIYFNPNSPTS